MLLAQVRLQFNEGSAFLSKEVGRKLSKELSSLLDKEFQDQMISFYPSHIRMSAIELIVEAIGSDTLVHSGGVDWKKVLENVRKTIQGSKMDSFTNTGTSLFITHYHIQELSFGEAASSMLYCYKQDDFLIPDSDPHDVMAMESRYNTAPFLYRGRFTPYMKLWCDCVQPSNMLLTGGTINPKSSSYGKYTVAQELEYKAFDQKSVENELNHLNSLDRIPLWRPFNRYYKGIVSNRTMIPMFLDKLIPNLKNLGMIISNSYTVLDLMDLLYVSIDQGNNGGGTLIDKWFSLMDELKGTTLVLFIDCPNHFLMTEGGKDKEAQHLQLEKVDVNSVGEEIDNKFRNKMNQFNLLDIDDSLDFADRVSVVRKITHTIDESRKAEGKIQALDRFNILLSNLVRNLNVIVLYTDKISYETDFLLEKFVDISQKISIEQIRLSDPILNDEQLYTFGQSMIRSHYMDRDKLKSNILNDAYAHFDANIKKLLADKNVNDPSFKSLYEYRFLLCDLVEYTWNRDWEGNDYFLSLKDKANKKAKKNKEKGKSKDTDSSNNNNVHQLMEDDDDIRDSGYMSGYGRGNDQNEDKETNAEIELDKMIGLTGIKEQIKDFSSFVMLNNIKKKKGFDAVPISKHMVFMGNPGTAKTSVARQLARILHSKGLLPTANLVQVSRDDLVGKYVGWTAKLTADAIRKAKGGILFVDEAYALTQNESGANDFGRESVDTFVNYMDKPDVRDTTIIIFAGYKKPMKEFIDSNPGLKSRIGFYFDFPDYSTDELLEIAQVQAKHSGYTITPGYLKSLRAAIEKERGSKDFGNGRFVRGVFEKSILKQSRRLANHPKLKYFDKREDFCTLTQKDFSTKGMTSRTKESGNIGFNLRTNLNDDEI